MQFMESTFCREYRIQRVVKFGVLRKSALMEVLLFCANAPDDFLEREQGIKRVFLGVTFLHSFQFMVAKL